MHNVDLLDPVATQTFVDAIDAPLLALVHLVGGIRAGAAIQDASIEDLMNNLNTNVVTAFNIIHSVIPHLVAAGGGSIVTIGARDVLHPTPNRSAYNAAKSAVVGLTRTIAEEGRSNGIRANVLLPSILRTQANLAWGTPEEIDTWVLPEDVAATITHLIDPGCAISGATIPIFGGIPF
jgi:NAD(P)-dependent dehydrogenase (short-subunit alcohol dehydrogenase family)